MRLRWRGSRCWTTTIAAKKSEGITAKISLIAFKPPAEAAKATISKAPLKEFSPDPWSLFIASLVIVNPNADPAIQSRALNSHVFTPKEKILADYQPYRP